MVTPWGNQSVAWRKRWCKEQCQVHAGEEGHARPGWTTSRRGQESPWKSQSEWQRTEINGESMSMTWPTLGSRPAKEQNRTWVVRLARRLLHCTITTLFDLTLLSSILGTKKSDPKRSNQTHGLTQPKSISEWEVCWNDSTIPSADRTGRTVSSLIRPTSPLHRAATHLILKWHWLHYPYAV